MNWGNISSIVEETLQPSKFAMFKFENVYDYYLTEPTSIILNLAGEDKRSFEPIIRVEEKGKNYISWRFYSEEREDICELILRKVVWKKQEDKETLMSCACDKQKYDDLLSEGPSISIHNIYVPADKATAIKKIISKIDKRLKKGIAFTDENLRDSNERNWEMLRLYDWGQIHFTIWDEYSIGKKLGKLLDKLFSEMDKVSVETEDIEGKMHLKYSMLPETFKELYY